MNQVLIKKFYRFSDYLFKSPQMSERLVISSISGILRFGRYPAYHGVSEPHLALKSSKTVVETGGLLLSRQPAHRRLCGSVIRVGVIVQRHGDVGMSHDVL